ncbi:MAG: helicase-exonuclease AddAB subunit AddA [Mediterraneibacter gnavus]|uniref:ATP-dependent helicase/nuclease subunit A n=1 Tax=Mediterraneibacter gnavus TaxID=33038 RepID=A0A6N3FJY5_MEDGN
MSVQWTEDQKKVIELRNRNILVSAAAGSGKTAVLVERIIQRLLDERDPLDVDRLLIVTFTEAAAAEMKERIRDAIENALEDTPGNVHLQRQATLIHSARITTIHSFCLSVIREHFHAINLDPGFRIAEEGELKLLRQDVLEEMLESCYDEGTEAFLEFAEKFSTGRSDRQLEEVILQLYEYAGSYPQPEKWLNACVDNYQVENEHFSDAGFVQILIESIRQNLQGARILLNEALHICEESDGPYLYAEALEADLMMIETMEKAETFEAFYGKINQIAWKRLSAKKDETIDPEKKEAVKMLREKAKKMVKDLQETCFYETPEELAEDLRNTGSTMEELVLLVTTFARLFAEKKRSRNVIDFQDMEQFALQILTEEKDGSLVPSAVAREYQEQFEEVMIDEYQDSNLIQEAILTSVSTVSRGSYNVFMVGDVKQSIYRFRLSRPELFMEKYDTYSQADSEKQRIDLDRNFRSREEVLDATNYVFEQIMHKSVGGVEYDARAALYPGADYPKSREQNGVSANRAELLLVDAQELEEEDNARRLEARAVADRIKLLLLQGQVVDKKTKEYRPVQYKDIVILTRSIKGWADVFAQVLAEEGISAHVGSREGYFETYEVSVLLDYLQILDNERQDLPLAAVLTSPFAGLDARELAKIRSTYPELFFYEAVHAYASDDEKEKEPILQQKLKNFLCRVSEFRDMLPYTAMHDLLWEIIEKTGYGMCISAMPGGAQRMANVQMLVAKAAAYEGTSYKGLFNFVRYIEQLKKYNVDYGEANLADEQADTVRIMSIHKSKGLEFPIVIVAGMGKLFNTQDVKGSIVIHPELGVGMDVIDLKKRTKAPTLLKKVIQKQVAVENLGEEMRVLYVAMTRAKEKLILTGVCKDARTKLETLSTREKTAFLPYEVLSANSYLDWLLPAASPAESSIEITVVDSLGAAQMKGAWEAADELTRNVLENWDTNQIHDAGYREELKRQLDFAYPFAEEQRFQMKFTVSELKKRAYMEEEAGEVLYQEPEAVPLVPRFLGAEEAASGAVRGTAYHKFLELLDFEKEYTRESLEEHLKHLQTEGRISPESAEAVKTEDFLKFLQCESGKRMHQAAKKKQLYKEQPFVLGVDSGEIYPDTECRAQLLVQGIIDVYFEEEDGLVVLDYKTDRVRTADELVRRYQSQLTYYARALSQITGKAVKEKIIYSFALGKEINV